LNQALIVAHFVLSLGHQYFDFCASAVRCLIFILQS